MDKQDSLLTFDELTIDPGPGPRLDDLVLPPDVRDTVELVAQAFRVRAKVLAQIQGVAEHVGGSGLSVLLAGPSGTGKTAVARALARELKMELRMVSVSSLMSSFMGETTKHIEIVLRGAEERGVAVLFDEADAVAQSRGAGTGPGASAIEHTRSVGHLLSRLERFSGLAFFTTNRALDAALVRRMFAVIQFHNFSDAERLEVWDLWRRRLAALLPFGGDVSLGCLASARLDPGDICRVVDRALMVAAAHGHDRIPRDVLEASLDSQLNARGALIDYKGRR